MAQAPDTGKSQVRVAAVVIVVAMVLWMGLSWVGGEVGLAPRWAFLIDLAALAAFFWALMVLFFAWRRGAGDG